MAVRISRSAFVDFARTLEGQELTTRIQQQPFTVHVTRGGLEFVPGSTRKPRLEAFAGIERMLEQFAMSGSSRPSDYLQITGNASYLLTLIALYHERAEGATKGRLPERWRGWLARLRR